MTAMVKFLVKGCIFSSLLIIYFHLILSKLRMSYDVGQSYFDSDIVIDRLISIEKIKKVGIEKIMFSEQLIPKNRAKEYKLSTKH